MLPSLLSQILMGEPIASVTADCAYDGRACRDTVASRRGQCDHPAAPQRQTVQEGQPWGETPHEALHAIKRYSRTLYHRRSRVEIRMNCMKLPGQKLMSRDFDRQTAELQVRVAILNRFTALGIPVTNPVDQPQAQKWDVRP